MSGKAEGAWVVLRRGDEWLDRRFLAWPYTRERQPGVEIEIEPATRLEGLIGGGEGPTIEFKEELPTNDADSKRNVMKTVAAFANGDGGAILFGVTNEGQIDGVDQSLSRRTPPPLGCAIPGVGAAAEA
jgi:Putative DNA-binding domain